MHILIPVLHRPSKPTGVCRHAVNLAQCLIETKKVTQVTLIIGEWQKQYFTNSFNLSSPKVNLVFIEIENSSLSRNKWFLFGLPAIANRLQPDIVHLSFPFPFVRQWFTSPVVSTIHDLYPYECPENFGYPQVWFNRWFLRQCINNSNGLSCVSQSTLKSLKHYFSKIEQRKKTTVIYNYVDFSNIVPQIPKKLAFEGEASFLLCVAQHRKNKNLDLLIRSYELLLNKGKIKPSIKLILVGSPGPETLNIQNLIETLKLQDRVILLSALKDEELCWLYKNCELFIIPSSTEGFCLPLVEAITLSQKIVCSDIPIFQEVGLSRCHYFNLENEPINNLSEAIVSELARPASNKLSSSSPFSKDSVARQLLDFYVLIR